MKAGIHPKYKKIIIKISQDSFETMSTYPSEEFLMDVDYRNHPAWNKNAGNIVRSNKNISDFNEKFAGLSF